MCVSVIWIWWNVETQNSSDSKKEFRRFLACQLFCFLIFHFFLLRISKKKLENTASLFVCCPTFYLIFFLLILRFREKFFGFFFFKNICWTSAISRTLSLSLLKNKKNLLFSLIFKAFSSLSLCCMCISCDLGVSHADFVLFSPYDDDDNSTAQRNPNSPCLFAIWPNKGWSRIHSFICNKNSFSLDLYTIIRKIVFSNIRDTMRLTFIVLLIVVVGSFI
jgi:hypothetical protein